MKKEIDYFDADELTFWFRQRLQGKWIRVNCWGQVMLDDDYTLEELKFIVEKVEYVFSVLGFER